MGNRQVIYYIGANVLSIKPQNMGDLGPSNFLLGTILLHMRRVPINLRTSIAHPFTTGQSFANLRIERLAFIRTHILSAFTRHRAFSNFGLRRCVKEVIGFHPRWRAFMFAFYTPLYLSVQKRGGYV